MRNQAKPVRHLLASIGHGWLCCVGHAPSLHAPCRTLGDARIRNPEFILKVALEWGIRVHGTYQDQQSTVLIIDCLTVDHWPSQCWLLILPSPQDQQSTVLIINRLTVDCWPSHCWLDPPPRINSQQCWSLITSLLTINPLTVDCQSSPPWSTQNMLLQNDHASGMVPNFIFFSILIDTPCRSMTHHHRIQ